MSSDMTDQGEQSSLSTKERELEAAYEKSVGVPWIHASLSERACFKYGYRAALARENTERPEGDSHWATVVIEPENFEPREATEAELGLLSDAGITVERLWIRPGWPHSELPEEHKP